LGSVLGEQAEVTERSELRVEPDAFDRDRPPRRNLRPRLPAAAALVAAMVDGMRPAPLRRPELRRPERLRRGPADDPLAHALELPSRAAVEELVALGALRHVTLSLWVPQPSLRSFGDPGRRFAVYLASHSLLNAR